ncbi:hypothetical protein ES703_59667 [subsurface metagenome]
MGKYDKYVLFEPHAEVPNMIPLPGFTPEEWEKFRVAMRPYAYRVNSSLIDTIPLDFQFTFITKPSEPEEPSHPVHTHDDDEFVFFMGTNPENMSDFGGVEIEFTFGIGEDKEVYILNKPGVVYIPKGVPHLPLVFKKVPKPFLFGHILVAPDYTETRL